MLCLLWSPGIARARDALEVWPVQIEVSVLTPETQQARPTWGGLQSKINLNIDTRQISGQTWRLWLIPRAIPANFPVKVIKWEGHPPMISGTAAPDQRVLAGEGTIDGHLVQTSLSFWAQGSVPAAGVFPVQFDFILETLP